MRGQFAERYEMVEKLGEGGMGVVHLVRDKRLNRLAAVKVLLPQDTAMARGNSGSSVKRRPLRPSIIPTSSPFTMSAKNRSSLHFW